MKIQEILKDSPHSQVYEKYKSDYIFEVLTVEEILKIHKNDEGEYELWETEDGNYHIAKLNGHEVEYAYIIGKQYWIHLKSNSYGSGNFLLKEKEIK